MALANKLRVLKARKKKLQDQELTLSDLAQTQEFHGGQIKLIKCIVENSVQPIMHHLLQLTDGRELEHSIRETAANIIKIGNFLQ